jgi:hypothetical protein
VSEQPQQPQPPQQPLLTITQIAADLRAVLDQLAAAGNSGQPPNFQSVFLSQLYSQYVISLIPAQLEQLANSVAEITNQQSKLAAGLAAIIKKLNTEGTQ